MHYADPRHPRDDLDHCHVCGVDQRDANLTPDLTFPSHWSTRYICEECQEERDRELERADTIPSGEVI